MNPDAQTPKRRASKPRKLAGKPIVRAGDSPAARGKDLKRAAAFKRTLGFKRDLVAAKPARQTDATSSGPGYGKTQAKAYKNTLRKNVRAAVAGRPFDAATVTHAVDTGQAPDRLSRLGGRVFLKHPRKFLPDEKQLLDPEKGGQKVRIDKGDMDAIGVQVSGDAIHAPVLKVLDQTTRVSKGVAGLATEGPKGFKKGLIGNKPYSFGKVLKDKGVPAGIAAAAGFALDVATDPTTYATFGTASVARHAAEKEAARVYAHALDKGMTREGAAGVAEVAAKRAAKAAAPGKGITVKFAGRSAPGVTTATAKAGRGVRKAAGKAPQRVKNAAGGAKNLVSDVRPQMRQAGVSEAEHTGVRAAGAQARAQGSQGVASAERRARAARKLIPKDKYEDVIAAIERGNIGSLPTDLQKPARDLRDSLRHAKRVRRQAGVSEGDVTKVVRPDTAAAETALAAAVARRKTLEAQQIHALEASPKTLRDARAAESAARKALKEADRRQGAARNYFPHALADDVHPGAAPQTNRKGVRKVDLGSSRERSDLRPIADQNPGKIAAGNTPFSTKLPLVFGNYLADTATAVTAKNLGKSLAAAGREFKQGAALHADDAVFHYHNGDLTPLKTVPTSPPKNGRYVVLNRKLIQREFASLAPNFDRTHIAALFDKGTGAFKRLATFTPGFHARNAIGDTQLAYLAQPGHRIPGNAWAAGRVVRRLGGRERLQQETLGKVEGDTRRLKFMREKTTVKIAGQPVAVDSFLDGALKHGVVRSGYIGKELREQQRGGIPGHIRRAGGRGARAGNAVNRWMQNREDWMRLATYKHGLDRGMPEAEAAAMSRGIHIDYGDLTKFERGVARPAMPFYTFSSRALPTHAKALVQKPGKFANYQKLREEAATATGVDLQEEEKGLKTYQARQAPVIINVGKKWGKLLGADKDGRVVVSAALPLTLLNEVPTTTNVGKYLGELTDFAFGMVNPIIKNPVEFKLNKSFFFRSEIEQEHTGGMVAAPSWAGAIYKHDKSLARTLGIVPDYVDKRTGKTTWGWRGRSDYVAKSIPGVVNFAQQLMTEGNRRGQTTGQKVGGFVFGVKVEPKDKIGAAMELLFRTREALSKEAGRYTKREKTEANRAAAAELRGKLKQVEAQINRLSQDRGDAIPLFRRQSGGPPIKGLGGGGLSGGGLGSGGLSGGGL